MPEYFIWGKYIPGKEWANVPVLSCSTWQHRGGWQASLSDGASHILHSRILLQKSQTPLQPFPVRSNSFKQETCEEETHTYLQVPKFFSTCCFCEYHNSWCYHRKAIICVSDAEDSSSVTPVTAIITEAVSQSNLAHSSGVWGEVGTRAGVWQTAPGRVHAPFYTLSHGCASHVLCVQEKLQWQEQAASVPLEWCRERTECLAATEMFKTVFLWYFMWLWWKNQWPLQCC